MNNGVTTLFEARPRPSQGMIFYQEVVSVVGRNAEEADSRLSEAICHLGQNPDEAEIKGPGNPETPPAVFRSFALRNSVFQANDRHLF